MGIRTGRTSHASRIDRPKAVTPYVCAQCGHESTQRRNHQRHSSRTDGTPASQAEIDQALNLKPATVRVRQGEPESAELYKSREFVSTDSESEPTPTPPPPPSPPSPRHCHKQKQARREPSESPPHRKSPRRAEPPRATAPPPPVPPRLKIPQSPLQSRKTAFESSQRRRRAAI